MHKNSLVSIIIPSYGGAGLLSRCINSVLVQTYPEIEVIVVDDNGIGTPHQIETARIMSQYQKDNRVKYICHEKNINGSAARNTGFRSSCGEFIAFLDDDDEYNKDFIRSQVQNLKGTSNEYAISYSSFNLCSNGTIISTVKAFKQGDLLYDFLIHSFEMPTSSMLFKRCVVEEFGGFDETFKRHQDWEFVTRILSKYKVIANDIIGYRRHLIFRNSTNDPKIFKDYRMFWLNKMKPYIAVLDVSKQENVYFLNKMDVLFMFLKSKDLKGTIKEWKEISPGLSGIKYVLCRLFKTTKKGIIK